MKTIGCILLLFLSIQAFSQSNYSLQFDGNDYVTLTDSEVWDFGTQNFTISLWVYRTSANGMAFVGSKGWSAWSSGTSDYSFDTFGGLRFQISTNTGAVATVVTSQTIPQNEWTHIAIVRDQTGTTFYINGEAYSGGTGLNGVNILLDAELLLGARGITGSATEFYTGLMDEVTIWNVARTQQEIQDYMNVSLSGNESGLIGYYTMSAGSGQSVEDLTSFNNNGMLGNTTSTDSQDPIWNISDCPVYSIDDNLVAYYPFNGDANDESGNGNNGNVSGATLTTDRNGAADKAFYFDGTNDFIDCGNDASLDLTNALTISAWIRTDTDHADGYVLAKGNYTTYSIDIGDGYGKNFTPIVNSSHFRTPLEFGVWKHIAYTYDQTDGKIILYVDGVQSDEFSFSSLVNVNTSSLQIGRRLPSNWYFKGIIDDIRIYNRALTNNEILSLYAEVSNESPTLETSATDVSCNGGSDGSIDLTTTGGIAPYTFSWSNGETTEDINGLAIGTYTVTVTDANNNTATINETITEPEALFAHASITDVNPESDPLLGYIDVTVTGGTSPYSYIWDVGYNHTGQDLSEMIGTWYQTITDNNGCTIYAQWTINKIHIHPEITYVTCTDDNDGSIETSPYGGAEPLSFLWSNGETTKDIYNLAPGEYTITVTDQVGATTVKSIDLYNPDILSVSGQVTQPTSVEALDGEIIITVSGGWGSFMYNWSNSATTKNLSNIGEGTYTVTVTDGYGCTETDSYTTLNALNNVTFNVTDGNDPVSGADVTFNSTTQQTNENGQTVFPDVEEGSSLGYSIEKTGHHTTTGTANITSNRTVNAVLLSDEAAINLAVQGSPTSSSVTLTWTGTGADYYQIRYNQEGTTNYSWIDATSSPFTIYNLNPSTAYECKIKSYISGQYTDFTGSTTFTTSSGPQVLATNLAVQGSPTSNAATLTWTGSGASYYQLRYNQTGTTNYSWVNSSSSPFTISNLNPSTEYECRIKTNNGSQYSNWSDAVTFSTTAGAQILATNLAVQGSPTANAATLIWTGSGATYYQLRYNQTGTTNYSWVNASSSPFTISNLNPSTEYECRIKTYNGSQYSNWSDAVTFSTMAGAQVLATNLAVQGSPTANAATFSWTGSGATYYQLRYNQTGTTNYSWVNANSSPFTISNLNPDTEYECRIKTYNGGQYSNWSDAVTFSTTAGAQILATSLAVQGSPTANAATLTWTGTGATYYQLRYNQTGTTNYSWINTSSSPFTISNLNPDTEYECRIKTYNSGQYSNWSSAVTFSTAAGAQILATNLAVQGSPTANAATLTWTGTGATYYQLRYNQTGTTNYSWTNTSASPFTISNLNPDTEYECRIKTYNSGQYSNWSSAVTFSTTAGAQILATNLAVQGSPQATSVTMSWNGSGADYYQLRYNISGTTDYTWINTTSSPLVITDLSESTDYECRIKTNTGGQYSNWSDAVAFTTGETKSLNTLVSKLTAPESIELKAYPNPFVNNFTIIIHSISVEKATICISNISGKVLHQESILTNNEYKLGQILDSGIYFVNVYTESGLNSSSRIIKIN